MEKRLLLFFGLFLMQSVYHIHCAEQLQSKPLVEDCMDIVVQKTRFPNRASQLVAGYLGYRVKKTLPAQESVCVEHVMPDGSLVCVTRDGRITKRDFITNKVLISTQFPREDRERWSITRPVTSLDNNRIVMVLDNVQDYKIKQLIVLDMQSNQRYLSYTTNCNYPETVDPIITNLPDNALLVAYKRSSPIMVMAKHAQRGIAAPIAAPIAGYDDIIPLPGNRIAAARNGIIMLSSLDAPLQTLESDDVLRRPLEDVLLIEKLMALPDSKLSIALSNAFSGDAWLEIFDIKRSRQLSARRFPGEKKIDLALLADGDIAVKKQESGEVEIVYADGFREALPLGKKATTIQGLSNRDLFVKHPDGTKSLVTNKFEKRANIHVSQQGTFLRWLNRAKAFPLVKE